MNKIKYLIFSFSVISIFVYFIVLVDGDVDYNSILFPPIRLCPPIHRIFF